MPSRDNPFLQFDEFALHPKKFPKIRPAFRLCGVFFGLCLWNPPFWQHSVLDFHLQLLVETVDQVLTVDQVFVDTLEKFSVSRGGRIHLRLARQGTQG